MGIVRIRSKASFKVFLNLVWQFKVTVVDVTVLVFTVVRRVLATDLGSSVVDPTTIVCLQMTTGGVNQQIPDAVIEEDAGVLMQEIPANEIEVFWLGRCLDRQSEILATLGRAVVAKALVLRNRFAWRFDFGKLIHVGCSAMEELQLTS